MRLWMIGFGVGLALTVTGCGEPTVQGVPKEMYEEVWKEHVAIMVKRGGALPTKDLEASLKKHNLTQEVWKQAVETYGISKELQEYQQNAILAASKKKRQ